jgi:hypothetical protein
VAGNSYAGWDNNKRWCTEIYGYVDAIMVNIG